MPKIVAINQSKQPVQRHTILEHNLFSIKRNKHQFESIKTLSSIIIAIDNEMKQDTVTNCRIKFALRRRRKWRNQEFYQNFFVTIAKIRTKYFNQIILFILRKYLLK